MKLNVRAAARGLEKIVDQNFKRPRQDERDQVTDNPADSGKRNEKAVGLDIGKKSNQIIVWFHPKIISHNRLRVLSTEGTVLREPSPSSNQLIP